MLLKELQEQVYEANMGLQRLGLVVFTWGNASGFDRDSELFAIKPSGVEYDELEPEMMVVCNVDGDVVEGNLKPSSDTLTHAAIYKSWGEEIGGVVHTHSNCAVAWAQAGRPIPCYGTTHADYFYGAIPCTRGLSKREVEEAYELNTGRAIVETFGNLDPTAVPGCLVRNHGPFAWGGDAAQALENAKVIEEVALMALRTEFLEANASPAPQHLLDKHYSRKHGSKAYYGQ